MNTFQRQQMGNDDMKVLGCDWLEVDKTSQSLGPRFVGVFFPWETPFKWTNNSLCPNWNLTLHKIIFFLIISQKNLRVFLVTQAWELSVILNPVHFLPQNPISGQNWSNVFTVVIVESLPSLSVVISQITSLSTASLLWAFPSHSLLPVRPTSSLL